MAEIFTCTVSNEFLTEMRDLLTQYQLQAKEIPGSLTTNFEIKIEEPEDGRKVVRLNNDFNRKVRDAFLLEHAKELRKRREERIRKANFWRRLTFRSPLK